MRWTDYGTTEHGGMMIATPPRNVSRPCAAVLETVATHIDPACYIFDQTPHKRPAWFATYIGLLRAGGDTRVHFLRFIYFETKRWQQRTPIP